jgi:hypothetical protein
VDWREPAMTTYDGGQHDLAKRLTVTRQQAVVGRVWKRVQESRNRLRRDNYDLRRAIKKN